ncbi:extensin family protein [Jannaschia sp. M317]|uniref:extensin-like domain-containing protein n=1 Tax=Jannaschia sp. M317 TaxID=2867011 RepID=UPI0021A3623D|nr:extensin family protein [Jannaschia sp. M317]UWQ18764.1 extensin family protein [Jannaschia sp. M317]
MRVLLALLLTAGVAQAEMRPLPRPAPTVEVLSETGTTQPPAVTALPRSIRPVPRRDPELAELRTVFAAMQAARPIIDIEGLVQRSDRPLIRDGELVRVGASRPRLRSAGGGLCGSASIQGEAISAVSGPGACGIPRAVRITSVSGVQLLRPARMDCGTAQALDTWVRSGLLPVVGNRGGGAVGLRVAAGYACRTRNSQRGARISEHGRGRAIDISAIILADGSELQVLRDWDRGAEGRLLRELHARACGPFGTVLGPESDRFHRDHFHFDTASYRSGSYCR